MSVTAQTPYNGYTANGATTVFPYGFLLLDTADLTVTVDGVIKALTTDYTVSGLGNQSGGNITFLVAPTNGAKVLLSRLLTMQRLTDYQNNGDLFASTVNQDFDRLWLALQQLQQNDLRALKLPYDTATDQVLTQDAAARANKGIRFDASGNMIISTYDPDAAQASAASSATAAAGSATSAASSATAAAGSATAASGSATAAANSATEAANSASSVGFTAADIQKQTLTAFTAAGTADAITGTLSPVPAALVTGLRVSTTPPGANTVTAPTLNVNALGAKKVFKKDSSGAAVALAAGDYNASGPFDFEYNTALDAAAGGWVLLNPMPPTTTFASSAENAAGTIENKAVDPLGIREAFNATGTAPVYACRAWVNFNGTGTVTIRASGNVSSITDNGVGDYTVNFTNAMPDANYSVNGITTGASTTNTSRNVCIKGSDSGATLKSTTQLTIQTANVNTTFVDVADISISIFR